MEAGRLPGCLRCVPRRLAPGAVRLLELARGHGRIAGNLVRRISARPRGGCRSAHHPQVPKPDGNGHMPYRFKGENIIFPPGQQDDAPFLQSLSAENAPGRLGQSSSTIVRISAN
ncbi:MAG: hypothetical protein WDN04_17095 [Rhodospirillales bacterium]